MPRALAIPFRNAHRRPMVASLVLAATISTLVPEPAVSLPRTPRFGPVIEGYAPYVGQRRCRPRPKPGVVAFRDLVLAAYPETRDYGIGRRCSIGGRSEHKEGRAWDWGIDRSIRSQRIAARELIGWLLGTDRRGNRHAMLRRLGIMYMIYNRRVWRSWARGWDVYCVQKRWHCRHADTRAVVHPHTDHVHFSFSWPGARKRTTFWNPELSRR